MYKHIYIAMGSEMRHEICRKFNDDDSPSNGVLAGPFCTMLCILIALATASQIACVLPASQPGRYMLCSLDSPAVLVGLYLAHDKHEERIFAHIRTRINGLLIRVRV